MIADRINLAACLAILAYAAGCGPAVPTGNENRIAGQSLGEAIRCAELRSFVAAHRSNGGASAPCPNNETGDVKK